MNKKVFLLNNWIVVALFIISLFTDVTNQMMIILVGLLLALKGMQAILYLLSFAMKKYRLVFASIVFILLLGGMLVPFASLLVKGALLFVLVTEIFVHLVDGLLQYRQNKKTWMINLMISGLFILFVGYSLFSWKAPSVTNMLFLAISLSSIFYLLAYYVKGEFLGNFTLLNMNAAVYRDAFIPKAEYTRFANATDTELRALVESKEYTADEANSPYVTIYLHTWQPSLDMMGHCDMSYKGKVYAFSNYDAEKMKFGGIISVGTIGITPVKQYLNFCTDVENKLVYGYTLKLTDDEVKKMDFFIEQLYAASHTWQPQNIENNKAAKMILEQTDCEIREVDSGAFKNYFVMGANCVKLIDVMLNHIGIKTNASKALITPGEYFKIFDTRLKDKIIAKRVYWKGVNHEDVI